MKTCNGAGYAPSSGGRWPIFISQPAAPLLLIFFSWNEVVITVFLVNLLWALFIRYRLVILPLAYWGAAVVTLRWITCPGATIWLPVQETLPLIEPALKTHPLVAFAAIAILMPVVEEMLFRGLLYGALERRLPPAGVIMVTSLVFALCHFQIAFFIPILAVGILLGWTRSKTGSIGLPVLIHALNNGLATLMAIFTS